MGGIGEAKNDLTGECCRLDILADTSKNEVLGRELYLQMLGGRVEEEHVVQRGGGARGGRGMSSGGRGNILVLGGGTLRITKRWVRWKNEVNGQLLRVASFRCGARHHSAGARMGVCARRGARKSIGACLAVMQTEFGVPWRSQRGGLYWTHMDQVDVIVSDWLKHTLARTMGHA
jgi:hypothetical protein